MNVFVMKNLYITFKMKEKNQKGRMTFSQQVPGYFS